MPIEPFPLLQLQGYSLARADGAPVLRELSFEVGRGEIVAVVGESGSGKSQLLLSLLGLGMSGARSTGSACFDGLELVGASERVLRGVRGRRVAMLFQDPLLSWNPCLTIGAQLVEVVQLHRRCDGRSARSLAGTALQQLGLPDPALQLKQYPHELSGGMRQRAMLAMALLGEPDLLLADEPTTALDASTQVEVLDLLRRVRREQGLSILLVTHDLGVVARVADRALVMQSGQIVEQCTVATLLDCPASDYGRTLLQAAQSMERFCGRGVGAA